ncbi:MAG: hypothetical protein LIP01_02090 [Tannerellaceae bacterium]|nr:hypothetical protein [Tannerellaceae bacterium]
MTKFKGTQGVWYVDSFAGENDIIDVECEDKNGNVCTVAQVYSSLESDWQTPNSEECIANARLIAIAPQLLSSLQETCNIIGKLDDRNLRDYYADLAIQLGENLEVISKALGEEIKPDSLSTHFHKDQTVLVLDAYESGYYWCIAAYSHFCPKRKRHIAGNRGYVEGWVVPFQGNQHLHGQPVDIDHLPPVILNK